MKKTVLITGASSGLGLELAKIFACEGYDLVLVARSDGKLFALKKQLESAHDIQAYVFAKDLAEKDAAYDVYDFTLEHGIDIDILVNNAGFGDFGSYATCDWAKQYEIVNVNILALMQLTRCYLKPMTERRSGKILNMASVAAFQPGPLMSIYYASKAFVLSFTEALSVELSGSGVTAMALCPGPTKTGFEEKAELGGSGLFKHLKNSSSKDVAEYGYRELSRNKVVAVPGGVNKCITFLSKVMPRKLVRRFVYLIQK